MATVDFSVPEDVETAFNETFKGRNKGAVIAESMREAVERARRRQKGQKAIERILHRRRRAPVASGGEIRSIREGGVHDRRRGRRCGAETVLQRAH